MRFAGFFSRPARESRREAPRNYDIQRNHRQRRPRKGRISDWNGLPSSKSLFYAAPGCGLPIGNLTSQLFSNIYLSVLDDYVKRVLRCRHYGRYVDDFYIVGCCKEELLATIPMIRGFLSRELGLKLHPRLCYESFFVQFIEQGKWRSRGLWDRYACSMPPF